MTRVMATGVFDILHSGHLRYLQEAKLLGDELIVVVATDATVRKEKHEPITPEKMRLELVQALKPVDRAFLGKEGDMFEIVKEVSPDIIVLGYDQAFDEKKLQEELAKRNFKAQGGPVIEIRGGTERDQEDHQEDNRLVHQEHG